MYKKIIQKACYNPENALKDRHRFYKIWAILYSCSIKKFLTDLYFKQFP